MRSKSAIGFASLLLALIPAATSAESTPSGKVIGQNDAPVVNVNAAPAMSPHIQNDPLPQGAVGTLVANLVDHAPPNGPAGQLDNTTDADGGELDPVPGLGIAITSIAGSSNSGHWYYSVDGGSNWLLLPPVSTGSSFHLTANASTRLYFRPEPLIHGLINNALFYRAWDRTSGAAGTSASTANNGGATPYSSQTVSVPVTLLQDVLAPRSPTSGTAPADATVLALGKPAGTSADDTLIATIALSPSTAVVTAPPGWTLVAREANAGGAGTGTVMAIYTRLAGASEPAQFNFVLVPPHAGAVGAIASWVGVSRIAPIEAQGAASTAAGLGHAAPSVAATVGETRLLTFHAMASAASWTPPAGMQETFDVMSQAAGPSGVSMAGAAAVLAAPGATGARTATASGNADAGVTQTLVLRPVLSNRAPQLLTERQPAMDRVTPGAPPPVGATGTLVSALVDSEFPAGQLDNVRDPDSAALTGIAITHTSGPGTWRYSLDNGATWQPLGAPSHSNALLLAADEGTRLHFQPDPGFSGTIEQALTVRAWDRSAFDNGDLVSTGLNDGVTSLSALTDTVAISVLVDALFANGFE